MIRLFSLLVLASITGAGFAATEWSADTHILVSGDFDGDGQDDLLVIAKDPAGASGIALSNGSGQPSIFHQSWASDYLGITWSDETYAPHLGDFNQDGRDDVFLQRASGGNHYVLLTTSAGELTSIHQSISNSALSINWSQAERRIVIGDYNNDGRVDLFLQANSIGVSNVVALASTGAQFTSVSHTWGNNYLDFEWNVPKALEHAGDFNGDGRKDLLVQAKPNWVLIPYEGLSIPIPTYRDDSYGIVLSDGTGKAATVHDSWDRDHLGLEWSPEFYLIFVADFNGDGLDDILLQAKRAGDASYIVITDSNGQITQGGSTVHTLASGHLSLGWDAASYKFEVGDYNGDGRADIYMQALTSAGTNRIANADSTGDISSTPATHTPSGNFKKPVPGAIPGGFSVSNQGVGQYTIPIVAPAATGGLKPNLALSYSHLAGNGLAGMRWTLSGISAITRCQQTYGQDENTVAITYTNSDRFCLDGQRLVNLTGTYGNDGTEYRTELETFQRILQDGTQGGGPYSFRVDHGNGLSSYYGATVDSRIEVPAGSAVRVWYISYTEDQFGNRVKYAYDEDESAGEAVPDEITWTENSEGSLTAKYKVVITYEDRPADDQRSGYDAAGKPWASTRRIDRIDLLYGTELVKSYDLGYATPSSTGTGRSQLQEVEVCGANECLPATVFTAQDGSRGWGSLTNTTRPAGSYRLVGDLNADGKKDLFIVGSSNTWQVYLGNENGSFDAALDSGVSAGPNPATARLIDINSDGRSDVLYKSTTYWHVLYHDGTTFADWESPISTSNPTHAMIRDFDGDGVGDWLYRDGTAIKWRRNSGYLTSPFDNPFYSPATLTTIEGNILIHESWGTPAPDFNGDGRQDLVNLGEYCEPWPEPPPETVCTPKWTVLVANGSTYSTAAELYGSYYGSAVGNIHPIDLNGDGLDDLAYTFENVWYTKVSTGNGFATAVPTGISWSSGQNVVVADFDNDGREDLLRSDGDYWRIHRSNGSTLPATYAYSLASDDAWTAAYAADVSGDGFPEIVRYYNGTWHTHKHQSALPDVVTTFTDGLGHAVDVEYESLLTTDNYTVDLSEAPPPPYTQYLTQPRYVVTSESHGDGIGGTRDFSHYYETAYVDISGRNWFSFERHRVNDVDRGTYTISEFKRTFPLVGMTSKQELRRSSDDQLIHQVEQDLLGTGWISPNRWFRRVESRTIREYEVGGVVNGTHLRTIVEDPEYHATYGYVTEVTRTVTDPVSLDVRASTTTFDRQDLTTPWCLGLPGLVQTTNTLPDSSSAVRRVRYTWNADCSLDTVTDESETSGSDQLRTTYAYDGFGNPDLVSQDSVDLGAQNRSTDYDFDDDGQFPTLVTIVGTVNLATAFDWDYLTGQRILARGPDGLETTWEYDDFGRLVNESRPAGSTDFVYGDCYSCWPQNSAFFVRALDSDGGDDYQYFDRLQRSVGSQYKLPLGNDGREELRYNGLGQVSQRSQPYVSFEPTYWVTYDYDLVGRLIEEDAPISESATSGAVTEYDYRGHELWVTDPESNLTKILYDAIGETTRVTDALSGITEYAYHPFGELAKVTDAEGNETDIGYDDRGLKTSIDDPNMGVWMYEYTVYGELRRQRAPITTSPNWTTTLTYDEAGRIRTRCDVSEGASATACASDDTTTWTYYSSGVGAKGKLDTIMGPGHGLKYTYSDQHGLPTEIRNTLDGLDYYYDMTYDAQARIDVLTYPTSSSGYRFAVDYDYDNYGHLSAAKDGNTSYTYYTLAQADAFGHEVWAELGNGLDEYRVFDRATGRFEFIETGPSRTTSVQDLAVTYDEVGNVLTRANDNIGVTETFTYDALNRLKTTQVAGESTISINYSAAGRIESKSDVGAYTYGAGSAGPLAVTSVNGTSYGYDANGRMKSRGGDTITWYSYDLPKKINHGSESSEFSYGVDRARYKQVRKTGSTTNATIYYIGGLTEMEVAGSTTYRHYVSVGGRMVAMVERVGTTNTTHYLQRDHQGSVVEITNASGSVVQSLAFDAWGLRRNASDWSVLGTPFGGTHEMEQGYTGHEHLDNVELIHMHGRVQDPKLGRFISADPFVQAPYYSQSLNRYSYVWNNPTTLVDPSGFQVFDPDDETPIPEDGPPATPRVVPRPELPEIPLGGDPLLDAQYAIDPSLLAEIACASGHDQWCAGSATRVPNGGADSNGLRPGLTMDPYHPLARTGFGSNRSLQTEALFDELGRVPVHLGLLAFGEGVGAFAARALRFLPSALRLGRTVPNRLAEDVAVSARAPGALPTTGRSIGRASHNNALQQDLANLPASATDIRVNQQQVNALGQRVGINRPDLQYTLNGRRYYVEYEGIGAPRGASHRSRILANDPFGDVRIPEIP